MSSNNSPFKYAYNGNNTPSEAVVAAIADASNCDPLELEPLYEFIDPDALDELFHSRRNNDSEQRDIQIEFRFDTNRITMTADHIRVHNSSEARADWSTHETMNDE